MPPETATPTVLAALHAACFVVPRPWNEAEFTALLGDPATLLLAEPGAFLLARIAADEAEILTLATAPGQRRRGCARRLLAAFHTAAAARGARRALLEVAAGNGPARALYAAAGYAEAGRRRGYYRHPDGTGDDALLLARPLP
jgi:ribosomal-protein-alanine N-acetyltransferase